MFSAKKMMLTSGSRTIPYRIVANLSGWSELSNGHATWDIDGYRGLIYGMLDFTDVLRYKSLDAPPVLTTPGTIPTRDPSMEYTGSYSFPNENTFISTFAIEPAANVVFYIRKRGTFSLYQLDDGNSQTIWPWDAMNYASGTICVDHETRRVAATWAQSFNGEVLRIVHASPRNNHEPVITQAARTEESTMTRNPSGKPLTFANQQNIAPELVVSSAVHGDAAEYWSSCWAPYGSLLDISEPSSWSEMVWSRPCALGFYQNDNGYVRIARVNPPSSIVSVADAYVGGLPNTATFSGISVLALQNQHWVADPSIPYVYVMNRTSCSQTTGEDCKTTYLTILDISGVRDPVHSHPLNIGTLQLSDSAFRCVGSVALPFDALNPRVNPHNGKLYCEKSVWWPHPLNTPGNNTYSDVNVRYVAEVDLRTILASFGESIASKATPPVGLAASQTENGAVLTWRTPSFGVRSTPSWSIQVRQGTGAWQNASTGEISAGQEVKSTACSGLSAGTTCSFRVAAVVDGVTGAYAATEPLTI